MSVRKESSPRRGFAGRRLLLGALALLVAFMLLFLWGIGTQSGLRAVLSLAGSALPDGLKVGRANGRLLGPMALNEVSLELDGASVAIDAIEFEWSPARFLKEGIHVNRLVLSDVSLELDASTASSDEGTALALPDAVSAPVGITVESLRVADLRVSSADTEILVDQLNASVRWVGTQLELDHLDVSSSLGSLAIRGAMQTRDNYDLSVNADIHGVIDGSEDVQAQLDIAGGLKQLRATLELESPYSTQLAGTVDAPLREPHLDLQLTSSPEDLGFTEGRLNLVGAPTDYEFTGEARIEYLGRFDRVAFAGTGTDSSVLLSSLSAKAGDSVLTLTATLDWQEGLKAEGKLRGEALDPSLYVPELTGDLDLRADVRVEQGASGDWSGSLTDMWAGGQLVDLPLKLSGEIDGSLGSLHAQAVNLTIGENSLVLNGEVSEQADFNWVLDVRDAGQLSQIAGIPLAGSLTGRGALAGSVQDMMLDATLVAREIVVDQQRIDSLELELAGTRRSHTFEVAVAAPAAELLLAGRGDFRLDNAWAYRLDGLTLTHPDLDPARAYHEWQLVQPIAGEVAAQRITSESICLRHQVPNDGGGLCVGYEFAQDVLSADLSIDTLRLDSINALLPASVRLSGTLAGNVAWRGAIEESVADLSLENLGLELSSANGWRDALVFSSSAITLGPVDQALQLDVRFPLSSDGASDSGGIQGERGVFGTATLRPSPNGSFDSWPLASEWQLKLPNLDWLDDFSDLLDEFQGELNGGLSIAGSLGAPSLEGSTELMVRRALIPELGLALEDSTFEMTGVDGGLTLLGAMKSGVGDLALNANVRLSDGVALDGTLQGSDFLVIDSPLARATVSPDLQLSYNDNRLKIRGSVGVPLADIRLAKIPEGAVSASRDQRFVTQEEAPAPLDMDAEVTVLLGDDVRFEGLGLVASFGGKLTVSDRSAGVTTGRGEIVIKEGTYKAYGQDLRVENGKVLFAGGPVDAPGLDIRAARQATPEVEVGVRVQGSLLEPRLNVFSTPSMPESDQLAYLVLGRPLSSSSASENSLLQQAAMAIGVEGGTLLTDKIGKNLGVDTFGIESAPGTGTAQAALVVGKYLSPRLYVSYGYGLFEPISTLRMEYQLSRLWRIVTESTNRATGGDIFWVHERD